MTNTSPTQNRATASGKWAGNSSRHDRRNAGVGLFRESGEGTLHSSGLLRPDQLLHQDESFAGRMEGSDGFGGESRGDGGSYAGVTEICLGILLVIGLLTRPAALVAFLYFGSLWVSEWGTSWIWELLVPVLASFALVVGRAGRAWGVDALLARRWPSSPWW